ncbi:MAG: class I SAM-dependent methyltransferase [Candidatus Magasanikbacteria bacterium]|nr:class I SAM-dependent methyltransferase [Candidatus Magasanikbacteria bacterium]
MATANWQPTKAEFWKNLPSPARPWPSEVAWFEEYVLEKKALDPVDVLILGSTVEFRSMCHKNGVSVHVVDFSKKFYDILSEQPMEFTGPETFYEEDWRTMELGKQFDLIFGDWVPGVLHTKDYDVFFKNILRHLKDDGLFIGRECLRPNRSVVDLEPVLKEHYAKHADKYSLYESSMQFIYGFRPDAENMWNITAAQEELERLYAKGVLRADDHDFFVRALAIEKFPASIMVQEDFDKEVAQYFITLAKHHVAEPSSDWYPIYVLKKK